MNVCAQGTKVTHAYKVKVSQSIPTIVYGARFKNFPWIHWTRVHKSHPIYIVCQAKHILNFKFYAPNAEFRL